MYCLDEFSGTGTAAALYTLRRCKQSRAILIDNGHSIEYVKQWIPRKYHHRVLYIQRDINTLCADSILELVRQSLASSSMEGAQTVLSEVRVSNSR